MTDLEQNNKATIPESTPKKNPGEFYFLGFIVLMTIGLLVEALRLDGVQKGLMSASGSLPQLIAGSMLIFAVFIFVQLRKNHYREGTRAAAAKYLFSVPVMIVTALVIVYGFLLERLHFIATTLLFLWVAMFLLDRKRPVHKFIVSGVVLAFIYIIFKTIFEIVLP